MSANAAAVPAPTTMNWEQLLSSLLSASPSQAFDSEGSRHCSEPSDASTAGRTAASISSASHAVSPEMSTSSSPSAPFERGASAPPNTADPVQLAPETSRLLTAGMLSPTSGSRCGLGVTGDPQTELGMEGLKWETGTGVGTAISTGTGSDASVPLYWSSSASSPEPDPAATSVRPALRPALDPQGLPSSQRANVPDATWFVPAPAIRSLASEFSLVSTPIPSVKPELGTPPPATLPPNGLDYTSVCNSLREMVASGTPTTAMMQFLKLSSHTLQREIPAEVVLCGLMDREDRSGPPLPVSDAGFGSPCQGSQPYKVLNTRPQRPRQRQSLKDLARPYAILPGPRTFACNQCPFATERAYNLKEHLKLHDPRYSKRFFCPVPACPHASHRRADMCRHIKNVHLKSPRMDEMVKAIVLAEYPSMRADLCPEEGLLPVSGSVPGSTDDMRFRNTPVSFN